MKLVTSNLLFSLLIAAWPSTLFAADEPPRLSNNPFSRPSSEVVRMDNLVVESDDGSGPNIPLHATMVGNVNRLANVGGRVLKPGDDYQGYQLVDIHEQYAVFEREGRPVTVYVKPLLADDEKQDERAER